MSTKNSEKITEIDSHVSKHYNIIRRLGKGAYGIVWKAVDKRSKETVAVKKIFDAFRNQTDAQRTFREIMFLLSFANHENIIQLIGLHKANNDRDIYLVFEYMETDLHNVIKRGHILKDIHKVFIMYQLFKALKYIHSGNVIHRDLKPSNILLNAQCHCKIADFGLARSVTQIGEGDGEAGSDPPLTDYVATRWYRAPEILVASKRYTKGIDMWSLGCILGEMLLEKPLFPGSSTINQVERIMATLSPPTREDIASISSGYGSNLLEKIPGIPRKSIRELLVGVSEDALDLIDGLIVLNPNHRLTAVEALEHPYVACFHHRANEPERGFSVIPPFRDDVQLSIDDYRNKLYTMMDERHRRSKNMIKYKAFSKSKSKLLRLTEHFKKETNSGDSAKKTLYFSNDQLLKQRESNDSMKQDYNHLHAQNIINGNYRNLLPEQTKSCQCINHQQQQLQPPMQSITKSEGLIKTDQVKSYGIITRSKKIQLKLKKDCKPTGITNNLTRNSLIKRPIEENINNWTTTTRSTTTTATKMPNNITKHFASSGGYQSYTNQVIQNYLNQTMPVRSPNKNPITKSSINNNYQDNNDTMDYFNINRDNQKLKNHFKYIKQPSVSIYNQNHGIITASAYRNLRTETMFNYKSTNLIN